jgi:hypothetical protein
MPNGGAKRVGVGERYNGQGFERGGGDPARQMLFRMGPAGMKIIVKTGG